MLEVAGLSVRYGKHLALSDIGLQRRQGRDRHRARRQRRRQDARLLKAIAGLLEPAPGASITLGDVDLGALEPHEIVEAGITLVPEGRGIFADLTVRENLLLGAYPARARQGEDATLAMVLRLFPRLDERAGQRAGTMSGGEQQMVAIGRALMSSPDVLLLDEPSLGLSPILCKELFQALVRVRASGPAILLVEQNARQSLAIADRGYIIENGRNAGDGTAIELTGDPAIQRAYLGGAMAACAACPTAARGCAGLEPLPRVLHRHCWQARRRRLSLSMSRGETKLPVRERRCP